MSRIIATAAIRGAHHYMSLAERQLADAIERHGATARVGFPNTGYYLPLILALFGRKVETLKDCQETLVEANGLVADVPSNSLWLPYLGSTLDSGIATLVAQEVS